MTDSEIRLAQLRERQQVSMRNILRMLEEIAAKAESYQPLLVEGKKDFRKGSELAI